MLTIGKLARNARVTTDTIRFYERVGLVSAASKTSSGYRLYTDEALRRLTFIRHAQRCGFSLPEIRDLLQPSRGDGTPAPDSYALAVKKKTDIDQTIHALCAMSAALSAFIGSRAEERGPRVSYALAESPLVSALASRIEREPMPEQSDASSDVRAQQAFA